MRRRDRDRRVVVLVLNRVRDQRQANAAKMRQVYEAARRRAGGSAVAPTAAPAPA